MLHVPGPLKSPSKGTVRGGIAIEGENIVCCLIRFPYTVLIYSYSINFHTDHTVTMLQSYLMLLMEEFVHGVPFWEDMDYMEVFRSPHLCR